MSRPIGAKEIKRIAREYMKDEYGRTKISRIVRKDGTAFVGAWDKRILKSRPYILAIDMDTRTVLSEEHADRSGMLPSTALDKKLDRIEGIESIEGTSPLEVLEMLNR